MAKYFKYERGISDGVVRDICMHKFNNGEIRIADGIVEINADGADIEEWVAVQNCDTVEITIDEAKAWRMNNPTDEVIESMTFLSSTDYKMTIDYAEQMSTEEHSKLVSDRAIAREKIRAYKEGRS